MSQASNSGPNMPLMLIPVSEALPAVQAHFERWASHDDVPPSPQELRELVDLTYRFVAVAELLRNYCGIPGATKRQLNMAPRSQCFETAAHVARFSRSESHIRQAGAWREATSAALARDGRTPAPGGDVSPRGGPADCPVGGGTGPTRCPGAGQQRPGEHLGGPEGVARGG